MLVHPSVHKNYRDDQFARWGRMKAYMFRSMRNMPIFRRLFIAFALATVIPGIIVVSLGVFAFNALNTRSLAVATSFAAQNAATDQQITLSRINALLQTRFAQVFALNGKAIPANDTTMRESAKSAADELSRLEITFGQKLQAYQQSYDITTSDQMADIRQILVSDNVHNPVIDEQHKTLHLVITQQWVDYKKDLDKVVSLLQSPVDGDRNVLPYTPDYTTTYQALSATNKAYLDINNSWQTLVNDATVVGTAVTNISGPSFTVPLTVYTLVALLLTVLIIVGTGYIVDLTITQPLRQLVSLTKRIANGETEARAEITGRDEISAVASSINKMLEHIVHLVQEEQDRHGKLQSQVGKLVAEVGGLGAGDLTIQVEATVGELGMLATSFNYMIEELGNLVIRVKALAKEVGTATTMSFECMTQLVEVSTLQDRQVNTAVSNVSDMAASSRNVAERARLLSDVAHKARYTAMDGHAAVQQAVAGIERISHNVHATSERVQALGERSREIGDIVNTISSIAHQTNRLALDAAVQAAMAGENGTGFAAVATDIRNLAERAKEQTLMINHIVHTVLEDINSAAHSIEDTERETVTDSRLIEEAGQALDSVFCVVEQQANEIATINQVTVQQLVSSNAIVQIMENVSASTRLSNATIRETTRLMEHVALLAEELHASVHVFKVHEARMQQGFPVQKRLGRTGLSSPLRAFGSTTRPLPQDLPLSANKVAAYRSTPYLLPPITEEEQRQP